MTCKHCGLEITNVGTDGKVYSAYVHRRNSFNAKIRCDPERTGQPYGLEAEPAE